MQHKKIEVVPATTREVVERVTCDMCGAEIRRRSYETSEVTVSFRKGESCPESGSGTLTEFDICASCFETKLEPWLSIQGAEPRETEWEY